MNNEIVYDAELEPDTPVADVYDKEEEIKQKEEELGLTEVPQGYRPEIPMIDENQKNVFDNGLRDGVFLQEHLCPMCSMRKKSISEMYSRKRFSKKKTVVGYMSICANCGFTSFYCTDPNKLLKYFSGKAIK